MNKIFNIKKTLPLERKNVSYILGMFAILYIIILYLFGIYFNFYTPSAKLSFNTIISDILPISIFIIATEFIREKILFGDLKYKKLIAFIITMIADILININNYNIKTANGFLAFGGFIICTSIAYNLLFNYISIRYGKIPIIIYRLITTLYIYIFPIIPNVHMLIHTLLKLLLAYIIYVVLENTYETKSTYINSGKNTKMNKIINILLIVLMIIIAMSVTCKFKFGSLVIGSTSMTGTIDKGDIIIFEKYNKQSIYNNQIIAFEKDDKIIVHRIVEIKYVNDEKRYYTKGDANNERDSGYITDNAIIGLYKFKINKIGELTLIFNKLFEG